MADTIDSVLKDAYEVFATSAPAGLNVCTNCRMLPADEQAMRAGPPSAISDRHLFIWSTSAFENEEFSHKIRTFLAPRVMQSIFELDGDVEETVLLDRVPLGDSSLWNAAQNDLIQRFHDCYLAQYRTQTEVEPFLDDVLCMFSVGKFPIEHTLDALNAWRDEDLINRLWLSSAVWSGFQFWESVSWDHHKERDRPDVSQDHKTVKAWYRSPSLKARIDTYLANGDPETNTWSRAAEVEVAMVKLRSTASK